MSRAMETTPSPSPRPNRRGAPWIRREYARWIQLLAFLDLLGKDKRPSQSKIAAFLVLLTGCLCALWQVLKPGAGASEVGSIGASTVTVILGGLSASFGMKVFGMFLNRTSVTVSASSTDATAESTTRETRDETRNVREEHTTESITRNIVEDPDGDFERTP